MQKGGIRLGLALLVTFMATACTTSNMVNVNLYDPVYRSTEGRVVVEFRGRKTLASKSVDDWEKVIDLKNITKNDSGLVLVSRAAASPTQEAIVYFEQTGKSSSIYRQSLNSEAKTTVSSESGLNFTPSFTPDGRYLIFSSDRSGEAHNLWRKRADGAGGITQITTSNSFDLSPSVSADGETIIFQSHRLNNLKPSIWSVNMNGGLLTQLAAGMSPQVSPDGRRIVFVRTDTKSGNKQIWQMQIDGSELTQLSNSVANDVTPSWHPNNRYIIFSSDEAKDERNRPQHDIWSMRADGTQRTRLTSNVSHDDNPVFDRNGKVVVFRSNRGGHWNLFSFKPNL